MKLPNFFIIGAPRCGTTSLTAYLAEHPKVFMSSPKEPFCFNTDLGNRATHTMSDYLEYFKDAGDEHLAVGEASTCYLYSDTAVPNILRFNPDAKFIVMLRNPVDMAYSLHSELIYSCQENVEDFRRAWQLQDDRKKGHNIPKLCQEPRWILYREVCMLGNQLERLYSRVNRERVLVLLLEDMKERPKGIYEQVLDFLALPSNSRNHFPIHNESKKLRFRLMRDIVHIISMAKRRINIKTHFGVLSRLDYLNTQKQKRPPLPDDFRHELLIAFKEDVAKLSNLIHRDLSSWINVI